VNVLALAGANSQIGLNNVSYQGFLGNAKVVFPAVAIVMSPVAMARQRAYLLARWMAGMQTHSSD